MKRIMVYLANGLGDVVFSLPAIMELRRLYPHYKICIFGWEENVSLIHSKHFGDEFHAISRPQSLMRFLFRHPENLFRRYEAAFTFRGNIGRLMLLKRIGLIGNIYSVKTTDNYLFDKYVEFSGNRPTWKQDMETLQLAGLSPDFENIHPDLFLTETEKEEGEKILDDLGMKQPPVIIHPSWTTTGQIKALPLRFVKILMERLSEMGEETRVLLGPEEKAFIDFSGIQCFPENKTICRKFTGRQLAAVLSCAKLVISADSGPAHIADAARTPVISLWGPTSAETNGMFYSVSFQKKSHFECNTCYNKHFFLLNCRFSSPCMLFFSAEDVLKEILPFLHEEN